jgi:plasmid stability protein
VDQDVYEGLKELASAVGKSMEAQARELLAEGVRRRQKWLGAKLADLSGDTTLADLDTPFARSQDTVRDVAF